MFFLCRKWNGVHKLKLERSPESKTKYVKNQNVPLDQWRERSLGPSETKWPKIVKSESSTRPSGNVSRVHLTQVELRPTTNGQFFLIFKWRLGVHFTVFDTQKFLDTKKANNVNSNRWRICKYYNYIPLSVIYPFSL